MKSVNPSTTESSGQESAPAYEGAAWESIRGTWKPIHGSFLEQGLSIEWHDFHVDRDMDWGRSFHPGSLEVCLNFSGAGTLQEGAEAQEVGPNQVAIYTLQNKRLRAMRRAESMHRFLTLELSPGFLGRYFSDDIDNLKPQIKSFIKQGARGAAYLEIKPMPASLLSARVQFLEPPVPEHARKTWYLGRVLEILSQTVFLENAPGGMPEQKHQRTNRERIERVRFLIERDLENPPSLDMLAQEVGCSAFYLSRVFAQETGASIPKFLRMKRIEKAAELIKAGRMNVTEAAMTVGYSSLSAFTKAFVEQVGCCPGLYPHDKLTRNVRKM